MELNADLLELGRLWKKFYGDIPLPLTPKAKDAINDWFAKQPIEAREKWGMKDNNRPVTTFPAFNSSGDSLGNMEFHNTESK